MNRRSLFFVAPLVLILPASNQASGQSPASELAAEERIRVRVESTQPVTLHYANGSACQAPCEIELAPGEHTFGVSLGDRPMQRVPAVSIDASGILHADYANHAGLRTAGWIVFVITAAATVGGGIAGALMATSGDMLGVGAGFGVLALAGLHLLLATLVGIPMIAAGDGATLRFE